MVPGVDPGVGQGLPCRGGSRGQGSRGQSRVGPGVHPGVSHRVHPEVDPRVGLGPDQWVNPLGMCTCTRVCSFTVNK